LQCKFVAGSYFTKTLFYTLNKAKIFILGVYNVKIFQSKQIVLINWKTPTLRDWLISQFDKRDKCLIYGSWDTYESLLVEEDIILPTHDTFFFRH